MKKGLKITLWSVLGCIAALLITVFAIWNGEIRSIASIEQIDENGYLYKMDYKAKYDLDKVLNAGIDENSKLLSFVVKELSRGLYKAEVKVKGGAFSCTSFQAKNSEGGYLFGRNYDYFRNPTLVAESHPKDGYSSLCTCDMSHFGYSLERLPDSFVGKALCLAAVYAPMDGINEKGLCISIMALPKQAAYQDTGKPVAGTSILMRLILDRCATVAEALELLSSIDVRHDQKSGSGYHYMVADAAGDCAVIEFDPQDNWKTMIVRKDPQKNFMHVTNHLLSEKYYTTEPDPVVGNPHSKSWWRYEQVQNYMEAHNGVLNQDEAQECLSLVHWVELKWDNGMIEDTQYSNVYDQSARTLRLRNWSDYERTYNFALN